MARTEISLCSFYVYHKGSFVLNGKFSGVVVFMFAEISNNFKRYKE